MRVLGAALALLVSAGAAFGNTDAIEERCRDNGLAAKKRVAACTRLIEDATYESKAWALARRGDALGDGGDHAPAVEDLNASLELEPDWAQALRWRGRSHFFLDDFAAAEADLAHAAELEPDNQWGHYFHGRALYRLDRDEEAVAAYSRAIDIRDDYFFSRYWRGVAYAYLDQPELARPDFEKAVELRPLAAGANSNLGEAYYDLELPEQAARSFRIAALLDPNLGRPEARLSELVEPDQEVTLPSLAFAPPAPGRAVRYLQIVMPRETRSEMELAIGALANWFAAPQKATPEQSMFVIRTARDITDDGIALELKLEESRNFDGDLPDDYVAFRGIVITDIKPGGESGPHIRIDYRDADLTSLWPLKAGNEMIGTGRYLLQCDHGPRMMLVMMGCRTGMSNIQIGSFEYSFMVHKAERIHVPLGTFDTHVLRYREKAELKILARTDRREIETNWWFSPDADFWVKRTSQMDDKILTVVATDVLDG